MKKVFYSWQKDLMTEYRALEHALECAVAELPDWEIERAERDPDGADQIDDTIIDKINQSDYLVADVSIVGQYARAARSGENEPPHPKNTANPNVLYEAGYGIKALTKNRVLLLASRNTTPETSDLPFDIRNRRTLIRDFGSTNTLAAELKEIISKPRPPIPGRGPYIFIDHMGGQSRDTGQTNIFFKNEESANWVLETVTLAGSTQTVRKNIANNSESKIVVMGLPIPPFNNREESVEFVVSREGDQYKIAQELTLGTRADEKFDLNGVIPSPVIVPITPPQ